MIIIILLVKYVIGETMKKSIQDHPVDRITPEALFLSRRKFLRLSAMFGTAFALAACGVKPVSTPSLQATPTATVETPPDALTPEETIASFNNYYEFSYDKRGIADLAKDLKTSPWPIEIGGLIDNPFTIDAGELIERYAAEERIYRLRCVEGWSMVIPWYGFPLNKLLADLKIKNRAKFVKFTTLYDPEQMPNQDTYYFDWPYAEGLRLDEAMHDLTLLAWGVYQKPLPVQEGAPLRLVVPWKYGFKSIKAIAKIELVAEQPATFWSSSAPSEYGFYANVNPNVDHPRWSQANEYRVGEEGQRPTLMFNGYEKEVAGLYEGMDLKENF